MDVTTIFLDECGYTGEDLLNADQPVFVLASIRGTEEECRKLAAKHFAAVRARELKHASLARRHRQQKMVLGFLEGIVGSPERAKVVVAHKRYVLVTKIVDLLVEPAAHTSGVDLYDRGGNIATANVMYMTIPTFGGAEFFEQLLASFQRLARERTAEAYEAFFRPLFERRNDPEQLRTMLGMIQAAHIFCGPALTIVPGSLDLAFTCALETMSEWRAAIEGDIVLIHDASSNMAKEKRIWDAVVDPKLEPKEVGYDRRKLRFPIAVKQTVFESSKDWSGLQLADIVAGAFARGCKWLAEGKPSEDDYGKECAEFVQKMQGKFAIWPSSAVSPEELGTTGDNAGSALDYYSRILEGIEDTPANEEDRQ